MRGRSSQADDRGAPAFHRASASRRRGELQSRRVEKQRQSRQVTNEIAESARGDEPAPVASATAEVKPLTVDDFMRAASTPVAAGNGIYASGESHPDEDVSLSTSHAAGSATPVEKPHATVAAKGVMAHVEAAPVESGPAPVERTAPSDLVGAPYTSRERATRTEDARGESDAAEIPSPTRQELTEEVEQPLVLPGLYRNGRLVVPPPLRGTREILMHQNMVADDEGLDRIQDDYDLRRMRSAQLLVSFPESASLHVNPELAGDRRCARPWTVHFASDIARAYYARFHEPLEVNSAVRTVAYQMRLRRVNGNAAGIEGDLASPHLTGQALDFGKHGMSTAEIAWMRIYLLPLMQAGKLDVEEEFQQACFHISVYRTYLPAARRRSVARHEVAQLRVPKAAPRTDLNQ